MATVIARDLPTTAANADSAEQFADVVGSYLRFDPLVGKKLKTVTEQDPDMPMALCLSGYFQMLFGSARFTAKASATHSSLEELLATTDATAREHQHAAALAAWSQGQLTRAVLAWEEILSDHPRDVLALRLAHHLHFYSGNAKRIRDSIARVLPHWGPDHPDYSLVLGMHAFGLEESGDYRSAELTAEQALAMEPNDPWTIHAMAHVMEMTGRTEDGIRWLEQTEANWGHANNFRFHIVWHKCLFHLEQQDYPPALALYDSHLICDLDSHFQLDLANAASMLIRLQLHGVDVGRRWQELARISADHVADQELVFMSLHHLLVLLAAGEHEQASRLLGSLRNWSGNGTSQGTAVASSGLALATGIAALTANQPAQARQAFDAALPHIDDIGGSRAQRDLFHMLSLHASRLTGDSEDYGNRVAERRSHRPLDSWPFDQVK